MIIFRVDASLQIGTGHAMRCLALGQQLRIAGEPCVFVTCMITPQLRARLESACFEIRDLSSVPGSLDDAKQTCMISKDMSASWIVLDGYHFNGSYQQAVKDIGLDLLVIDDYGQANHYYADIVLNQNIHASEKLYSSREPYTYLLLGTRYALLRTEFLSWQGWNRTIPQFAHNILVTLGGSDPENVTLKIFDAIQQLEFNRLNVIIIGANNQYFDQMNCLIEKSKANVTLKSNVSNMSDLMAWADIAVSAGGTSTWELAFMGLPMIIMAIAHNQCQMVEELGRAGVALNLGWHRGVTSSLIAKHLSELINDFEKRNEMSRRARTLIDGNGAERVTKVLRRPS